MKAIIRWILRVFYLGFALYGILSTVGRNDNWLRGLSYYTVQSNILCVGVMAALVLKGWKAPSVNGRAMSLGKSGSAVIVFLTFLVFHFVLRPGIDTPFWSEYVSGFDNVCVHYLCPLWFMADYLVFDRKGLIRKTDPFLWLAYPVFYYLYVTVYRLAGGRFGGEGDESGYPYFFLDPDVMGPWGVLLAVLIILAVILGLSFGLYGLDRLLAKFESRKAPANGD